MSKKEASHLQIELRQGDKKLSKQKRKLQERLQEARESQARAEERLQRMQERMQKRIARVQRLEEKLNKKQLQLQELRTAARAINMDLPAPEPGCPSVGVSDAARSADEDRVQRRSDEAAQSQDPVTTTPAADAGPGMDLVALAEAIVEAQDARNVAAMAEEAARIAIERAQFAEQRLNQFGTARHLEQELAQLQAEAERAQQIAQQEEQAAQDAEQSIWPVTLLDEEEESDLESQL